MACWRVELMQQMKPSIPERPVLVLGAGGHARVVAATLLEAGRRLLGYIDTDVSLWGTASLGGIVLGGDERLSDFSPLEIGLANGIGSVRQPTVRRMVFEQGRRLGFSFETVIHPRACVSPYALLAEGVQVMAGAVVQAGTRIGANTIINSGAVVDHDCWLGEHVHVAPGATLSGGGIIGNNCHIGTGAVVIQGVTLGADSVIGAGAVVINSHPARVTLIGVPAKTKST